MITYLTFRSSCQLYARPIRFVLRAPLSSLSSSCQEEDEILAEEETTLSLPSFLSSPSLEPPTPTLVHRIPPLSDNSRARLYLLRHGETLWNARGLVQGGGYDIELNSNGIQQAIAAANELSGFHLDMIVSSHMRRAVRTAEIISVSQMQRIQKERHQQQQWLGGSSRLIRAPVLPKHLIMSEFGEMCFGNFEGKAWRGPRAHDETRQMFFHYRDLMCDDINIKCPGDGAESTADVERRVRRGINHILTNYPTKKHIAIVAHGRTNTILLSSFLLNDVSEFIEFRQGNVCINVLDIDMNGKWKAQMLNYRKHVGKD